MLSKRNPWNIYKEEIIIPTQSHIHPPKNELVHLYVEKGYTQREIAESYKLPVYIITYLISTKYKIYKTTEGLRKTYIRKRIAYLKEKGITKDNLENLYREKQMTMGEIAKKYKMSYLILSELFEEFNIPIRSVREAYKIYYEKNLKQQKEESKTFTHKKMDEIKQKIENHIIDPKNLSHAEVCRLASCNPGIEKLKQLCDIYGYDFEILTNTYRKMERIFYKRNLYPKMMVKIGIVLYLRYEITQDVVSEICRTTSSSIRKYLKILKFHMKLPIRRSDPLTVINISWLFRK